MKALTILLVVFLFSIESCTGQSKTGAPDKRETSGDKIIFVYGNGMNTAFIKYVASLTGKERPRICLFPTAAADNPMVIDYWYKMVADLPMEPGVIQTFVTSAPGQKSFEEDILSYDAVLVGGGNTLNMLAIWKAQGIDTVLRKAYEKGIVLAGGSAGSLCWFTGGYTDSRPKELTLMECLGFLNYSHCPHYNGEPARKPLYHNAILDGKLQPGYACDDEAGLLFVNGEMKKSISLNNKNNNYYVSVKNGRIFEEKLPVEILR